MNVHDSEQIVALLKPCGYEETDRASRADVILVNTCSIREKAAQKVYSQLGRFSLLKKNKPNLIIGVGGCLAQQFGKKMLQRAPFLDLIFGTHNNHMLPDLLGKAGAGQPAVVETTFRDTVPSIGYPAVPGRGAISAFVTIMQGCNNFCSFCIVPYVRGREESRELSKIVDEIKMLADQGIQEVTLLGQNVNSYGSTLGNGYNFPGLLAEIDRIDGIRRIRFTTSHPKDLSDELIGCFGSLPKLCDHIHLPVQSGSDRILKRMNRRYTRSDYLKKVAKLRSACPGISITSDIIVGFPGETEEDYEATLGLMQEVKFDGLFSFQYSEREGTAAAAYKDKVQDNCKRERLRYLQLLQDEHTLERNKALVGRELSVLVEGYSRNTRAEMTGRTTTNRIVNFGGLENLKGKTVWVRINEAYLHSLHGEQLEGKEEAACL
ncbi:MAG: tRNA (N6-isopentenyl adenosine(37)-C2)-methylthiotransferase MiaB [Syntrophaceae bacterium]|nr:tRNA (N6-isopentenyl adenosine(37)-C2)-methylthiotransferase MiaB [Syntrophaceae bacterium]